MKTVKVQVNGWYSGYLNRRLKLCWCGQLKDTTHACTAGLPRIDIYEYKKSVVTAPPVSNVGGD